MRFFDLFNPMKWIQPLCVTDLGDIPSGAIFGGTISHASVASNGANATYGGAGAVGKFRAPVPIKIVNSYWEAEGADSDAANTASYRRLEIIDGGADATGTAIVASLGVTASLASDTQRSFSNVSNASFAQFTVDAGDVLYVSQLTVGAAHSTGTILVAGSFRFDYMPI